MFLTALKSNGLSYSSINTARSAVSSLSLVSNDADQAVGNHPLVRLFMRGVFVLITPLPKTVNIWNPETVLKLLKIWSPMKSLSLKLLSYKTAMLMLLTTGHRGQTILACSVNLMHIYSNKITFNIQTLLKTSKPGQHLVEVVFHAYEDKKLCPVVYLREYIKRTKSIRKSNQLLIQISKPHAGISRSTLRRWTQTTMQRAGIDTSVYSAHSTRSAATSFADKRKVPLADILASAGWKSSSTFARHYNKPVKDNATAEFSRAILSSGK